MLPRRRVVVTGMGAITPLGNSLVDSWNRLLINKSGSTTLEEALKWQDLPQEHFERELEIAKSLPCQVAAPVRWCHYESRTPRFVQLTLKAGSEAMHQANLLPWLGMMNEDNDDNDDGNLSTQIANASDEEYYQRRKERVGVCVGSAMSSVREITEGARLVQDFGVRKLSPHFVPKALSNSASGRLSLKYQLRGPNHTASTACAAGSHAIGDAFRCILHNNADIMLAGGAEAAIDPFSIAGFCRLRALSTKFSDTPQEASRPFDKSRDGFVMGEGSAILVLEELEHAKKRGVPILAELCGYGLTGDAYHITSPDPHGSGAERAMRMAINEAINLATVEESTILQDIGYVNAHATSTPKGDEIEALAIDRIFSSSVDSNNNNNDLFVSSTKGATGHLLGAAGAIEAAFSVLSLVNQSIPPTCNLQNVDDDDVSFQHVTDTLKESDGIDLKAAISNSFGFGGTNASLLFKKFED